MTANSSGRRSSGTRDALAMPESPAAQIKEAGFVRLRAAFAPESAARMQARIWEHLEAGYGIARDNPGSWQTDAVLKFKELKYESVFTGIGSDRLIDALDGVLGKGQWKIPEQWGQFLVALPKPSATWQVPDALWHTDFDFATDYSAADGALVIAFISRVGPQGGGTCVVRGSHAWLRKVVADLPATTRAKMKSVRRVYLAHNAWIRALHSSRRSPSDAALIRDPYTIDSVELEVHELTGEPGDVVIGHPWLLHCPAMNASNRVKMMCVQRIHRLDHTAAETPGPV